MLVPCQRADSKPAVPVPRLTLTEVLRAGLPAYARTHRLPAHHWKVINVITACRTGVLGGLEYQCAYCHRAHVVPHSCGNRHCPTCQWSNSQTWLEAQAQIVLPIPYFHVVFTLPHELNALIQQNQQVLYDLLFASVSQTLLSFGRNNLKAQLGLTAVLHTWGQTLTDHYHLHCIVTGGGVSLDGQRWNKSQSKYLFNATALSRVFRGKFCAGLQELYAQSRLQFHGQLRPLSQTAQFQALVRQATREDWV